MTKTLFMLFALALLASTSYALDLPPGVVKLQEYQTELALSITLLLAFIGGLLTFTSPCGFVIIPTYFSYVFKERKRALFMTSLFSLGMTGAFVIFGIIAALAGSFFNIYKEFFATLSGIALVFFGSLLIFNKGFTIFNFKVKHKPNHSYESFFLGFLFAIGWTPCVGPILGGVILLAANTAQILRGALLFGSYALGVSLPLLLIAYFSDRHDFSKWFTSRHVSFTLFGKKIHTHLYGIVGGLLLIAVGIIMFIFEGTRVFMVEIPKRVPWTMDFFTMANERLVESTFFTSMTANVLGIALALLLLFIMIRAVRYSKEYK